MAAGETISSSSAGSFKLSCTFSLDDFGISLSSASGMSFLEIYILASVSSTVRRCFFWHYEDLEDGRHTS